MEILSRKMSGEMPSPHVDAEEPKQNFRWSKQVQEESLKYYPERGPEGLKNSGLLDRLFSADQFAARNRCERQVVQALEKDPLVKLMIAALENAGCPINPRRHISCEVCHPWVTGGYDNRYNQVVVCQGISDQKVAGSLAHELLHMYDFCRAKLDWDNVEHVACTEIRAANLFHCSMAAGIANGSVDPLHVKGAHRHCVMQKAVASVLAVRPELPKSEAWRVTASVFDKCYYDLEPIGRRPRKVFTERLRAYRERFIYGYI